MKKSKQSSIQQQKQFYTKKRRHMSSTPVSKKSQVQDIFKTAVSQKTAFSKASESSASSLPMENDTSIQTLPSLELNQLLKKLLNMIKLEQQSRTKSKRIIQETLGRMILRKMLINKNILRKIRSLPEKNKEEGDIGEKLIWKTKISLQTSLLRSLFFRRHQQQEPFFVGHNITVYPYREGKEDSLMKQSGNAKKKAYCQRVIRKVKQNCHTFINRLRVIKAIQYNQVLQNKRKIMRNCLNRCLDRREKLLLEGLKSAKIEFNFVSGQYLKEIKSQPSKNDSTSNNKMIFDSGLSPPDTSREKNKFSKKIDQPAIQA